MTDKERLENLQTEIHRLEAILKPLYEERKQLKEKLKEEHRDSLPYNPQQGWYFKGKSEELYLYRNSKEKTYYTKPLYNLSGSLMGYKISKKFICETIERLKEEGYALVL